MTKAGEELEKEINHKFSPDRIQFNFKNHVGDGKTEFNDMMFHFKKVACHHNVELFVSHQEYHACHLPFFQ